jgi:hypothetical protein
MSEEITKGDKTMEKSAKSSMPKKQLLMAGVAVLIFVAGGGGGYVLGKDAGKKATTTTNLPGNFAAFGGGAGGTGRRGAGGPNGVAGGRAFGEVIASDATSITIKLANGNTKTILINGTTTYQKNTDGTKDDVKVGDTISVNGTANTSGSITATTVQTGVKIPTATQGGGPASTQN